jgi:hypothetical protein
MTSAHDPGGKTRYPWPSDSKVLASFSACKRYRYELSEIWDVNKPLVMFLLMNPSVADLEFADPTLFKTGKYARAWGYGGQLVGNAHAYRATDKGRLLEVEDPVGSENDKALLAMAERADMVLLAYGQPPKSLRARGAAVTQLLSPHRRLAYLRLANDGTPCHPLYLADSLRPIDFLSARKESGRSE